MANDVNARLIVQILANSANFVRGMRDSQKELNTFVGGIKNIAGAVGIAFGVQQVVSFATEVAKLSGQAEGVRAAFDRIPESKRLLEDLKEATSDTVSELDLMKRTVQAANFGISLQALPKLLEFAAVRAQQTGQSVEFLVDSIVTGVGRKSTLILDNLGISAVRLKEQFGGAALEAQSIGDVAEAVGRIAEQELSKMGGFSQNTATQFEQLAAAWDNFKVTLGSTETGIFNKLTKDATNFLKAFGSASDQAAVLIDTFAERISEGLGETSPATAEFVKRLQDLRREAGTPIKFNIEELRKQFNLTEEQTNLLFYSLNQVNKSLSDQEATIAILIKSAREYFGGDVSKAADDYKNKIYEQILALEIEQDKLQAAATIGSQAAQESIDAKGKEIEAYYAAIAVINEYIKALNAVPEVTTPPGLIESINAKLKELEEQKKAAFSESEIARFNSRIDELKAKLDTLNAARPLSRASQNLEVTFTAPDLRGQSENFFKDLGIGQIEIFSETLKKSFDSFVPPDFEPQFNAIIDGYQRSGQAAIDAGEASSIAFETIQENTAKQAQLLVGISDILAGAFEGLASGQQSAIQALQQATLQIIDLFYRQALAAAIAKAIQTGGPLPVGLALAGVALGVVKGLFKRETGVGGGGSGAGSTGTGARNTGQSFRTERAGEQIVIVNGEFKVRGTELVQVIDNTTRRTQRTG